MSSALYRTADGTEICIEHVPRGYVAPLVIGLSREHDEGGPHEFHYVGDGRCDKHMAHGAGHQSISRCIALGAHDQHHISAGSGEYYWRDEDMHPTPAGPNWGGDKYVEKYGTTLAYS